MYHQDTLGQSRLRSFPILSSPREASVPFRPLSSSALTTLPTQMNAQQEHSRSTLELEAEQKHRSLGRRVRCTRIRCSLLCVSTAKPVGPTRPTHQTRRKEAELDCLRTVDTCHRPRSNQLSFTNKTFKAFEAVGVNRERVLVSIITICCCSLYRDLGALPELRGE